MSRLQLQTSCENLILLPNEDEEGGYSPRAVITPKHVVQHEDPDEKAQEDVVPLVVRTGITLYEASPFDLINSCVDVTFDLWLVYDTDIYAATFGSHCERLPWTMPNALSLDITRHRVYHQRAKDLESLHLWTKRQKNEQGARLFTIEAISCRGTLKLTTFPCQDPFQSVYMVMKLAMDGTPGSERTQYLPNSDDCYFPGARKQMADFVKGKEATREFRIKCNYGEYSRLYCMFEYKKSPLEDIAKYYVLPLLINLLTILFYDDADSLFDSAGTYFLAIIALLFTMPETGSFSRSERSVVVGSLIMLINLILLILDPYMIVQMVWLVTVFCVYVGLLAFDYYRAREVNEKYKNILFDGDLKDLDAV